MAHNLTAESVIHALRAISSPDADVGRFFYDGLGDTQVLGVGIGKVFPVAKQHRQLPLGEIETLLESPYYEARMAAAAIMDFQAREKTLVDTRAALFELYMRRHDRLNNWDLVDRAAAYVVGQYLSDRSHAPLYELAHSPDPWRRRTAIVATYYFIRNSEVDDTFAIGGLLAADLHPMVQKAVGSWVRTAGEIAPEELRAFLGNYRAVLPAVVIRMATEKMEKEEQLRWRRAR